VQATQSYADDAQPTKRYLWEYAASGEITLPKHFHEWVYVGSPLTPNVLNNGKAAFQEYHNVYIERGSFAIYKTTNAFPEGTIFVKELQLTYRARIRTDHGQNPRGGVIARSI